MDKLIGKKLDGRYEVLQLVGTGGMANVYYGRDVKDDKYVAIKVLRSEFAENEEFLRRFKNESKAIAMLSHENIVKVYDVSFTERVHFIIMEYIDGITLKDYIEQQQVINWKEAAHFCTQILRGLQHAHDKGIVHRDIKPQNMMLLSDGTIKITDFGIARFARSGTHTITDRAIGSVHYISPEQASGAATDNRTDIYSVGIILYEMLTGSVPFDADTPISVALKQIQATPKRPKSLNPDIPDVLEEIVLHAMQKDVNLRYQSAAEMLNDFLNIKKQTVKAPVVTPVEVPVKPDVKPEKSDEKATTEKDISLTAPVNKDNKPLKSLSGFGEKKETNSDMKKNNTKDKVETTIPILPVMAGVTSAFIIVSLTFILTMFYQNNPFESVADTTVPELIGMSFDAVNETRSVSDNFEVVVEVTDYHPSYPEGVIYDQSPDPGDTVKIGSKIVIKISSGQKEVEIPNVEGLDAANAYAQLSSQGLDYNIEEVYNDNMPIGVVVSIAPPPGSIVQSGSTVEVQVSLGAESKTVMVPALVGMNISDASTLLENFKLSIGGESYEPSDLPRGTILEQDPPQGTTVNEDTYINVILSEGSTEAKRLRLTIDLPDIDENVRIEAMMDGVVSAEDVLNPSEEKEWRPVFEGFGVANIQIIIDNKLYREISLDFENSTYRVEQDLSAEFGS